MTDVDRLELPQHWRNPPASARASMLGQPVKVDVGWWNTELDKLGLPGGPVVGHVDGNRATDTGVARISRGAVLALSTTGPDAVFTRLWHALAWGTGARPRLARQRMRSIAERQAAVRGLLESAAATAHSDPVAAYRIFFPDDRRNAVKYLGSAFFTKYLHFSPAATSQSQALILDDRVADALHAQHGWRSLRTGGKWPAKTYDRYCHLLQRWATEASAPPELVVRPDEIEHWLFSNGRPPRIRKPHRPARRRTQ